ncbi:zinc knuckle family protein [Loa loa]|uniref:Zinc knuckle family protein n=1 Tax=Loa loa TaxID=7209 RepID=A0A1S0UE01_LOALO|nr:zinc knuckle family protein [Loa loa]EJD73819.1 zinc knuckle family protein [Loa loa]
MSDTMTKSAQPAKQKLEDLLDEIKAVNLTPPDQHLSVDEKQQPFELKKTVEEKIRRLKLYDMYKDEFELMAQRLQQCKINIEPFKQRGPSQMSRQTVNLPQLPLLTFSGDPKLWRKFRGSFDAAVHLQKIPDIQKLNYLISCLKGNALQAVKGYDIRNALQAVKGYDITPGNYDVIRKVLVEKFGNSCTIKKLYNESRKQLSKLWKEYFDNFEAMGECLEHSSIEIIIESRLPVWILDKVYQQKKYQEFWSVVRFRKFLQELVQRNEKIQRRDYDVIRKVLVEKFGNSCTIKKLYNESRKQLSKLWKEYFDNFEAMGECLEHSSIEIIIESRLPVWILDKVYQQKKYQEFWSVVRFRKFLQELVQRNEKIQRSQASSSGYQRKSIESKSSHNPRSARGETSALAAIRQPKLNDSKRITNSRKYPESNKIRRPCLFCKEDHWENKCQVYRTANHRLERLKTIGTCLNCLQKGHIAKDCRKLKKLCFHCKGRYIQRYAPTTAKILDQKNREKSWSQRVTNPNIPKFQTRALALFDLGLQLSFISTNLAKRLHIRVAADERLSIASFGNKLPKKCNSTKAEFYNGKKKFRRDRRLLEVARNTYWRQRLLQNQLWSGIIEEVHPDVDQEGIILYLLHYEVICPHKPITKLEMIHDASAYLKGTKSLNEILYRGPIMLLDLVGILLRSRMMKNVIIADVEKTFLQS